MVSCGVSCAISMRRLARRARGFSFIFPYTHTLKSSAIEPLNSIYVCTSGGDTAIWGERHDWVRAWPRLIRVGFACAECFFSGDDARVRVPVEQRRGKCRGHCARLRDTQQNDTMMTTTPTARSNRLQRVALTVNKRPTEQRAERAPRGRVRVCVCVCVFALLGHSVREYVYVRAPRMRFAV